jgi:hypothetical protein
MKSLCRIDFLTAIHSNLTHFLFYRSSASDTILSDTACSSIGLQQNTFSSEIQICIIRTLIYTIFNQHGIGQPCIPYPPRDGFESRSPFEHDAFRRTYSSVLPISESLRSWIRTSSETSNGLRELLPLITIIVSDNVS